MLSAALKLCVVLSLALVGGCASRSQPPLVDALAPGMHPAEAAAALQVEEASLKVIWETKLAPDDKRPPYSEKTLEGQDLSCLDVAADLKLSFYLDQLTSVTCYPKDAKAMHLALKSSGIKEGDSETFELDRGDVLVRGHREADRWAVSFTSKTLDAEQRAWVKRYS